ncbi:MAG TPA: peptidyl-dipeptidase Dcp [Acidobacteriaceae bacterium]|nr:peptidyl-dipeptidase Dcp [Acidobacteriaceae bacterium]
MLAILMAGAALPGEGAKVLEAQTSGATGNSESPSASFGPENPFYAPSTLPYQTPPFNRIKDSDYLPAIEAGITQHLKEVEAIANNPAPPTFENTLVALEKSGRLYGRVTYTFNGVTQANSSPTLEKAQEIAAPKMAAHDDAIFLNEKLFHRVETIYKKLDSLKLDPESRRLVDVYYKKFVHEGANLSPADKERLRKMNEEESTLENSFRSKLLGATRDASYHTTDKAALRGLTQAELDAATEAAKGRKLSGYLLPMQNTTQQPVLVSLEDRGTRQAIFEASWNRAEHGDANDTRNLIARLAKLRAEKAKLLGYPNFAAWNLTDQMAKTPEAAISFMDKLAPASAAKALEEAKEIQSVIDSQKGGFQLQPWDWEFYSEQVRKAKYDLDESQTRPYFEMWNVLENGVFYAANQLYGITFKERHDIPVYAPDVRVWEVFDTDGKPLALWMCDYYKRDNKSGGAWMDVFVDQTKLLGTKPVIYNVANFPKPAAGEPALLSFTDVTTMFHEFGHALHGMFSNVTYPFITGTDVPRDFVEFPSQFNEHWASYPQVFHHYAKHYKTGEPMPAELAEKVKRAEKFNQGYVFTELLEAAELDMQWHTLPASAPLQNPDTFEADALTRKQLWLLQVPPRYRSTYFQHIWSGGYNAGYYAYLWSEMLDDDAYQWFEEHGGLTRANGDRFRAMVLSKGNTQDLAEVYRSWRGSDPSTAAMIKDRGLD